MVAVERAINAKEASDIREAMLVAGDTKRRSLERDRELVFESAIEAGYALATITPGRSGSILKADIVFSKPSERIPGNTLEYGSRVDRHLLDDDIVKQLDEGREVTIAL